MRIAPYLSLLLVLSFSSPAWSTPADSGAPATGDAAVRTGTSLPAREPASAAGQPDDAVDGPITDVEAMLVSGQYSGPGLWKVSRGGNTLWILGTVAPVPKAMDWYSPEAEAVLAQSREIIGPPGVASTVGVSSMFKAAFAIPAILRARKNPDGKTLREVLPADLYARWSALKPMYLGDDQSVEQWRPVFAASQLYDAAIRRSGMINGSGVGERLGAIQKQHDIKRTSTMIHNEIKNPRKLAKSFSRDRIDDVECFRSVLDRLELDVANAAERANAWATGDIPELTRLFARGDMTTCFEALASTEAGRSLGLQNAAERSEERWLKAAETALASNLTSFGTLPVAEMLQPGGLLARLQARGYEVVVPE